MRIEMGWGKDAQLWYIELKPNTAKGMWMDGYE